jgi:hypothetical protein
MTKCAYGEQRLQGGGRAEPAGAALRLGVGARPPRLCGVGVAAMGADTMTFGCGAGDAYPPRRLIGPVPGGVTCPMPSIIRRSFHDGKRFRRHAVSLASLRRLGVAEDGLGV